MKGDNVSLSVINERLKMWLDRRAQGEEPPLHQLWADDPSLKSKVLERLREITLGDPWGTRSTLSGNGAATAPIQQPASVPQIPGYEVQGILGSGGMGVVFKAMDQKLQRLVALKMIRLGETDEYRRKFQKEAEAVARLDHQNIIHVYEINESQGQLFISLEFIRGGNLSELLEKTPQPPTFCAQMVELLARALGHAHAQGIVHRDLKPANILLQKTEHAVASSAPSNSVVKDSVAYCPKIADFGLAKELKAENAVTQTGGIAGTPSYMAPEQAGDFQGKIGPTTDVYALGAILYEMLTGGPPFRGTSILETIDLVRASDPVPPRRMQPKCPADLETICLKCLRKDPRSRYASANELADDLGRFIRGEPIIARPAGFPERTWRWCKRKPALAVTASVAVLSGVAAAVIFIVSFFLIRESRDEAVELANEKTILAGKEFDQRVKAENLATENKALAIKESKAREDAENRREEAVKERKKAVQERDKSDRFAYSGKIAITLHEIEKGDFYAAAKSLADTRPDLRGWEYWFLTNVLHAKAQELPALIPSYLNAIDISADGSQLAIYEGINVAVWNIPTATKIFATSGIRDGTVALSPDGDFLAISMQSLSSRYLDIYRLSDKTRVRHMVGPELRFRAMEYSPTGKHIAGSPALDSAGRITKENITLIVDVVTNDKSAPITVNGFPFAWNHDGSQLCAFDRTKRVIQVVDVASKKATSVAVDDSISQVNCICFDSIRNRIIASCDSGKDMSEQTHVRAWDVRTGKQTLMVEIHDPAWKVVPDWPGKLIAFEKGGASIIEEASGKITRCLRLDQIDGKDAMASNSRLKLMAFSERARIRVFHYDLDNPLRLVSFEHPEIDPTTVKWRRTKLIAGDVDDHGNAACGLDAKGNVFVWDRRDSAKNKTFFNVTFIEDETRGSRNPFRFPYQIRFHAKDRVSIAGPRAIEVFELGKSWKPPVPVPLDERTQKRASAFLTTNVHLRRWYDSFPPRDPFVIAPQPTVSSDGEVFAYCYWKPEPVTFRQQCRDAVILGKRDGKVFTKITITDDEGIACNVLTGDGKRLITATNRGVLKCWDTESGQLILKIAGYDERIQFLSMEGARLVTGSEKALRIWDGTKNAEFTILRK